jgi:hypothetical protein
MCSMRRRLKKGGPRHSELPAGDIDGPPEVRMRRCCKSQVASGLVTSPAIDRPEPRRNDGHCAIGAALLDYFDVSA